MVVVHAQRRRVCYTGTVWSSFGPNASASECSEPERRGQEVDRAGPTPPVFIKLLILAYQCRPTGPLGFTSNEIKTVLVFLKIVPSLFGLTTNRIP